jgi:hypothetical protein
VRKRSFVRVGKIKFFLFVLGRFNFFVRVGKISFLQVGKIHLFVLEFFLFVPVFERFRFFVLESHLFVFEDFIFCSVFWKGLICSCCKYSFRVGHICDPFSWFSDGVLRVDEVKLTRESSPLPPAPHNVKYFSVRRYAKVFFPVMCEFI